jgi:elongation factor P
MAVYHTSEFRKGLRVLIDGEPYLVIDMDFMKPGKGQAVYRCKLRNLLRGTVIDRNYRSGDTLDSADVTEANLQYMYNDGESWHFMNTETYDQCGIQKETMEDAWKWLKDGMTARVTFWGERPIAVEPPKHVDLTVEYCEPAARGNTATNVTKSAKLETGAEIQVPSFINIGDVLKVDTRTGEYLERVAR